MKKLIFIFLAMLVLSSCQQEKLKQFEFLIGTWQDESKSDYERWEQIDQEGFTAYTFQLVDGQEMKMEHIKLYSKEGKIYYSALVPNQNDGVSIDFIWNEDLKTCYSFENLNHDFPNKIQYKKLSATQIEISVLDKNNQGIIYIMNKI